MTRKIALETISILFIILWVYAGLSKLMDFSHFKMQLGQSPYIENYASVIVWVLPLGELTLACLLISKKTRLIGLYLSFLLMLLFTGYIYAMLNFSYYKSCSCGGILSRMSWNVHLAFNIAFSVLGIIGILLSNRTPTHEKLLKTKLA